MAVATVAAIVGATAAVGGVILNRNAQQRAAEGQERAAIESASELGRVGRLAEGDIIGAQERAIETIGLGAEEAEGRISPFVEPGAAAFDIVQDQILSGLPISGPLADSIRQASTDFVTSRPHLFDLSQPVANEVQRQADITVSGVTPAFTSNLLTGAQQGIAAAGDVGATRQRALERFGDVAASGAAQRATALTGTAPQLAQLSAGASEARLLSDVAGQRAGTDVAEILARLAGEIT